MTVRPKPYSYFFRNEFGTFCAACQSLMSVEEEDWGVCDTCYGEGVSGDDDDYPREQLDRAQDMRDEG